MPRTLASLTTAGAFPCPALGLDIPDFELRSGPNQAWGFAALTEPRGFADGGFSLALLPLISRIKGVFWGRFAAVLSDRALLGPKCCGGILEVCGSGLAGARPRPLLWPTTG